MDPFLLILFGATGDLAAKKLIPALCRLSGQGKSSFVVLGVGRSDWDDASFRDRAVEALVEADEEEELAREWAEDTLAFAEVDAYDALAPVFERAAELDEEHGLNGNTVYYLALPPSTFPGVIETVGEHLGGEPSEGWTRLVVEKPFGRDLDSARDLNELVHQYFDEDEVYRIDHYLGKETVQNLLVFRFANQIFESVWNRQHVERIEITVAESVGVEGRAGYYDEEGGALRDMIQNHLTQLFTLAAMEAPASFDADAIRQEKIKVLHSTQPLDPDRVVLGQYVGGEGSYRDHEGVPDDSDTETYAAVELRVANWRWQGVPFVLRTGKRLPERLTEIAVFFRCPPVALFGSAECGITRNVLRILLQPDEGFRLGFEVKAPGEGFRLTTQHLDFHYEDEFGELPDAYQTLLHDVAAADQTLFVHAEEAEAAWRLYGPILDADLPVHEYESDTWGPEEANEMLTEPTEDA